MPRYKMIDGETIPLTAEEEAQRDIEEEQFEKAEFDREITKLREKRNKLLDESDWVVLPDSPVEDKTLWLSYRTELRDITNGLTTVSEIKLIELPQKPEA